MNDLVNNFPDVEVEEQVDLAVENANRPVLLLHNDEVNTFDFVADSLVEVCNHEPEQALQCTYIIHYKGKCDVKRGTHKKLQPMQRELIRRGLSAEIVE